MSEIAILQQLELLQPSINVFCDEWCEFWQPAVGTLSAKDICRRPPSKKEPFTASRTPEELESEARNSVEHHPTKGHYVNGCLRVKKAHYHHPNHKHGWHVAEECK
jgi:hypothetical protein